MARKNGPMTLEEAQEQIFNLNLAKTHLEDQLNQLAGGTSGVHLFEELLDVRRQLAGKAREVEELNELFCNLEKEMAQASSDRTTALAREAEIRSAAALDQETREVALKDCAAAQAAATAAAHDAEQEASGRRVALEALRSEQLSSSLLKGAVAECDSDLAFLQRELAEQMSTSLIGQRLNEVAFAHGAQERQEKDRQLAEAHQEIARLRGSQAALSAQLSEQGSALSAAVRRAETAYAASVESEGRVGALEIQLQVAKEENSRSLATLATLRTTAEGALADSKKHAAQATAATYHAQRLEASLQELKEQLSVVESARAAAAEAAHRAEQRAICLAADQRSTAEAIAQVHADALEEARNAEKKSAAECDRVTIELETVRTALGAAQVAHRAQEEKMVQAHAIEMQHIRAEKDGALNSLQLRLEEAVRARACAEHKLQAAESDARRLRRFEQDAALLDAKCKALQLEMHKKSEAFERLLKRRGGATPVRPPTPPNHVWKGSLQQDSAAYPATTAHAGSQADNGASLSQNPDHPALGAAETLQEFVDGQEESSRNGIPLQSRTGHLDTEPIMEAGANKENSGDSNTVSQSANKDIAVKAEGPMRCRPPSPVPGNDTAKVRLGVSGAKGLASRESGSNISHVVRRASSYHPASRYLSPKTPMR